MKHFESFVLAFLFTGVVFAVNPWLNTDVWEFPKLVVLIVAVTIWTLGNLLGKEVKVSWPKPFIFLGLFVLGSGISFFLSEDRGASLIGRDMRFQGVLTHVYYLLLSMNAYLLFRRRKEGKVLWFLNVLAVLAAGFALLPYLFKIGSIFLIFDPRIFFQRVFGTFGNPNYLASFLVAVMPMYLLWKPSGKVVYKTFYWLGLMIVVGALFLTGSRSAWIAILLGFLFWGLLRLWKFKTWKPFAVVCLVIVLMFGAVSVQTSFGDDEVVALDRLSLKSESIRSLDTRVYLWNAGARLFMEKPLFGHGQDTIQDVIDPYLPEYLMDNDVFYIDRTHSELIDILVTLGVFGLINYVVFFAWSFWVGVQGYLRTRKKDLELLEGVLIGMVALVLFNAVNFATVTTNVLFYVFAVYLLAVFWPKKKGATL